MPYLSLDGVKLYYELHGHGQPVVLIHGLGSSSLDWEPQLQHLKGRYQVLCMDVRGHGRSDKPTGRYSISQFAADIRAVMQGLHLKEAHVVGLSMGGMIAFQLAVDAPALVRSLCIVNSGPELVARTLKLKWQLWQRQCLLHFLSMRRLGELLSERLFPGPEYAPTRELFVERWAGNDPKAYRSAFRALIGWSVSASLPAIRCPVLAVAADRDYTPVEAKRAWVSQLPQAELVVMADAHHAVTFEKPDEFNQVLDDFLGRLA